MYYSREQHKRFLDKELTAISEAYLKLLNSKAISLLSGNEIYVTQYIKLDFKQPEDPSNADKNVLGSGQLMLRFKKDKGIPRKNEYFTAVILEKDMCLPKNWGEITWGKLRSHQVEFSEVHCVWQGKADDNGFLLCGFSGISIEMSQYLINNKLEGCVIVLGPQEPPMEYYQNLISVVGNTSESLPAKTLLDFDKSNISWNPEKINSNSSQIGRIIGLLEEKNEMIIQGPPGTGKTHLMAGLVSQLIQNNKSVLVTAMTNRALIELAEKDSLKDALAQKKVKKTNVSSDELIACKNLCPVDSKQITCMPGCVTLSTFYNSSGWAKTCYEERPFDYVIMDEASQALFGMIAASMNLGKKIIWIGDQNQMQPIVLLSEETLVRNDYYLCLLGESGLVAHMVFIEASDNAITIFSYESVETFLGSTQPILSFTKGTFISAQLVTNVEITIAQGLLVATGGYPVVVHAKGTQHHLAIVVAQILVDGTYAFSLEFQEHGVDELHNVISLELRQKM